MTTARMDDNVRRRTTPGNRGGSVEEKQADDRGHDDGEEHQDVKDGHTPGQTRGREQAATEVDAVLPTSAAPGLQLNGADGVFAQTALRAMKW